MKKGMYYICEAANHTTNIYKFVRIISNGRCEMILVGIQGVFSSKLVNQKTTRSIKFIEKRYKELIWK